MIFRLVEDVKKDLYKHEPQLDKELSNAKETKSGKTRESIVDDIVSGLLNNELKVSSKKAEDRLRDVLKNSINTYGDDSRKNTFLSYLMTLAPIDDLFSRNTNNVFDNLYTLEVRASTGDNLDKEWYYNKDLLSRSPEDFKYVLNIADVLSNKKLLGYYYKHTIDKGIENIYKNGEVDVDSEIKETGIKNPKDGTIFAMVDAWTREDGKEGKGKPAHVYEVIANISSKALRTDKDYIDELSNIIDGYSGIRATTRELINKYMDTISKEDPDEVEDMLYNKVVKEPTEDALLISMQKFAKDYFNKNK